MPVIIGIDPSSRKLACTITVEGTLDMEMQIQHLPQQKTSKAKSTSGKLVFSFLDKIEAVYGLGLIRVYMESPTYVPRAGAKSLIPQAITQGQVIAWCGVNGYYFEHVAPSKWKNKVMGPRNGHATKAQIADWVLQSWPSAYDEAQKFKKDDVGDMLDSACINRYGAAQFSRVQSLVR